MKHKLVLVAVATLLAGVLTGCGGGGGDTEAYCDSLDQAKSDFEDLDTGNLAGVEELFKRVHDFAEEAPDDVADDWQVLDDGFGEMEAALNDAGLELKDLDALNSGQIPEGVDQQKLLALGDKIQSLNSEEFEEASKNIRDHAKDECDIDLGSG